MQEFVYGSYDPLKELSAAVLESVLRSYREPNELYPPISKTEFLNYLKSPSCHFYETILGWSKGFFYEQIIKANILTAKKPTRRTPMVYNA